MEKNQSPHISITRRRFSHLLNGIGAACPLIKTTAILRTLRMDMPPSVVDPAAEIQENLDFIRLLRHPRPGIAVIAMTGPSTDRLPDWQAESA